ncbi:hypothetical protein DIPPA_32500 [Diplonema papillatum]|nr:hypothetical protein DIPPA_32500 [Diplonema papillatum]
MFQRFKPAALVFTSAECWQAAAIGIVGAVHAQTEVQCGCKMVALAAVIAYQAAVVACLRPSRRPVDDIFELLVACTSATACCFAAFALFTGPSDSWGYAYADVLLSVSARILLARSVSDVATTLYVYFSKRRPRLERLAGVGSDAKARGAGGALTQKFNCENSSLCDSFFDLGNPSFDGLNVATPPLSATQPCLAPPHSPLQSPLSDGSATPTLSLLSPRRMFSPAGSPVTPRTPASGDSPKRRLLPTFSDPAADAGPAGKIVLGGPRGSISPAAGVAAPVSLVAHPRRFSAPPRAAVPPPRRSSAAPGIGDLLPMSHQVSHPRRGSSPRPRSVLSGGRERTGSVSPLLAVDHTPLPVRAR